MITVSLSFWDSLTDLNLFQITIAFFKSFQKQRMKIAFAEGYLAGNTNADGTQKGGKAMKYLKVSAAVDLHNTQ